MNNRLNNFTEQDVVDFEHSAPLKISGSKFRGMLYSWNACTCKQCRHKFHNWRTWKKYRRAQYK